MQLVTWNTQWCCGLDGVVSPDRIVQGARALADFDVLCLQEIAVNYPRLAGDAGHDQPARIAQLLPGFQVFFGAAVDEFDANGERRRFGNLIATRLLAAWLCFALLSRTIGAFRPVFHGQSGCHSAQGGAALVQQFTGACFERYERDIEIACDQPTRIVIAPRRIAA